MKPTPLLDFWEKPSGAGEPVAIFATTFALETEFFEQNCLARFLEVSCVNERNGAIDDIVASLELNELMQKTTVIILANRSVPVQRTSLLWDLLTCKVNGGLLHSKVSVLIWENATRVVLGSANLTAAGYRRQIELAFAADLGSTCLLPNDVLISIADELKSYLRLVPGYDATSSVFTRAEETLKLFRRRISQQQVEPSKIRVAFAPTNQNTSPLDSLNDVWNGPKPLLATHLSPFWDSEDQTVLKETRKLLTGKPSNQRSQKVAVVLDPKGQTSFSEHLSEIVDRVQQLKVDDTEIRLLHAKCLLIESNEWVAALVGSSNHTKAGLGVATNRRHREMNVWIGASKNSKEGKALLNLIQLGKDIPVNTECVEPKDEDEAELPSLPSCFGLCTVAKSSNNFDWEINLGITRTNDMPTTWDITLESGSQSILSYSQWTDLNEPPKSIIVLPQQTLPMYIFVKFNDSEIPWVVVAEDRLNLPPIPGLSNLNAQHLLDALANGKSLAQILRGELERLKTLETDNGNDGKNLDPLLRFDNKSSLLRKGRALAKSLVAMQRRLEKKVVTFDMLRAHLSSPLGPEFVATKVVEAFESNQQSQAEALFTIAEIALTVGRVDWTYVTEAIDDKQILDLVRQTLHNLNALCERVGDTPVDLASYAHRAIKEANRCLSS